jgi:hypothetical protein
VITTADMRAQDGTSPPGRGRSHQAAAVAWLRLDGWIDFFEVQSREEVEFLARKPMIIMRGGPAALRDGAKAVLFVGTKNMKVYTPRKMKLLPHYWA